MRSSCDNYQGCAACSSCLTLDEINKYNTIDFSLEGVLQYFCTDCYFSLLQCQTSCHSASIVVIPDRLDAYETSYLNM